MHSHFTAAEVAAAALRTKQHKAVAGGLPLRFSKAAAQLAAALAAQFNAWQRLGRLPPSDTLNIITPIPKAGGDPAVAAACAAVLWAPWQPSYMPPS